MKAVDSLMLINHLAQQQFVRKPVRVFGLKVMAKHVGVAIADLDTLRAKSYWYEVYATAEFYCQ